MGLLKYFRRKAYGGIWKISSLTINSLKKAYDEDKIKEDVYLQFRVIETTDFDLRAKITEFLNSQTQIKDSYFLANNPFIRALQIELEEKGYFLESY